MWKGKRVPKYFLTDCLNNVSLLPNSLQMSKNSKIGFAVERKGKIFP